MTGVGKVNSDNIMVGTKDSTAKTKKTDVFQSIMSIAQNINSKLEESTSYKNQVKEVSIKPTAKDVIVNKLNIANEQMKIEGDVEDSQVQMESLMGQLAAYIKEEIMDKLEIPEEELAVAMESLGLNDMDLLLANNITELSTYIMTGKADSIELLFNPEFAETLKVLQGNIKELQTEVFVSLNLTEEEFTSLVKQMVEEPQNSKGYISTKVVDSDFQKAITKEQDLELTPQEEVNAPNETKIIADTNNYNQEKSADSKQDSSSNLLSSIASNVVTNLESALGTITDDIDAASIIKQITDEIFVSIKQDIKSMEMQLYPEHLGKVHLEVISKNGVISASIIAETQMAKEAIESHMIVLKENLINQGVRVEEIEVTIASHQLEQNLDSQKEEESGTNSGKRKIDLSELDLELESMNPEEILEQSIMISNGNSVNLTA